MKKLNSIPVRIDLELNDVLMDIAKKNGISLRQASRELAQVSKRNMRGKKFTKEITF